VENAIEKPRFNRLWVSKTFGLGNNTPLPETYTTETLPPTETMDEKKFLVHLERVGGRTIPQRFVNDVAHRPIIRNRLKIFHICHPKFMFGKLLTRQADTRLIDIKTAHFHVSRITTSAQCANNRPCSTSGVYDQHTVTVLFYPPPVNLYLLS